MTRCMTPICYHSLIDTSLLLRSYKLHIITHYEFIPPPNTHTHTHIQISYYIHYLNKVHNKITFFMKIEKPILVNLGYLVNDVVSHLFHNYNYKNIVSFITYIL